MVCEEAPQSYNYGARAKAKNRFIGGVVTPAQPQYLHGMVDDRADAHDFQESPPILGIAAAVGGYKVRPCSCFCILCFVTYGFRVSSTSGNAATMLGLHGSCTQASALFSVQSGEHQVNFDSRAQFVP